MKKPLTWKNTVVVVDSCFLFVQMSVVDEKRYQDTTDEDYPLNDSEIIAANLSDPDEFVYYTVMDRDSRFLVEFNYWIQAFLFKLVPCVLLTVLTVMLIIAMRQANIRRMKLKSQVGAYIASSHAS